MEVLSVKTPLSYFLQYDTDAYHCITSAASNAMMLQRISNLSPLFPRSTHSIYSTFSHLCGKPSRSTCSRVEMMLHITVGSGLSATRSKSTDVTRVVCKINRKELKKQSIILGNSAPGFLFTWYYLYLLITMTG